MTRLFIYGTFGAIVGALVFYWAADGVAEGAIAGALLGASLGVLVAMRHGAGDSSASFEYEAAGIHDDNLITTARRNLVREAYRQTYERPAHAEMERRLGSARGRMLADTDLRSEPGEQYRRLEYRPATNNDRGWRPPIDNTQAYDLQLSRGQRKRKPKRKRHG